MSHEGASSNIGTADDQRDASSSRLSKAKSYVDKGTRSGGFAAVTGGATLLRALGSLRRGKRGRAFLRALAAGLWFGVALAQRRRSGGGEGRGVGGADVDETDVVDTSPDIESAAADSGRDRDGAGNEGVDPADAVDATTIDIDEPDTAPGGDHGGTENVDEADVVDTGTDVANAGADSDSDSDAGGSTRE